MRAALAAGAIACAGMLACAGESPRVPLVDTWPASAGDYTHVTQAWTRTGELHGEYQEIMDVSAIFKSPEWRAAHAERDAEHRGLSGSAAAPVVDQARADAVGPYEVELLVETWDRRENDLDHGKRSVWKIALLDESGHEIAPLEIVRDKRPLYTVRSEFPSMGDFAVAYIVRFPRTQPVLGPDAKRVRLRMSSERGGVELAWASP